MKKTNLKNIILSLTLGLVMILSVFPTNLNKLFAKADGYKNVYETPATIDVNGSFNAKDNSTEPKNWTVSAEYDNDKDKDSTSYNGILSTSLTDWSTTNEQWLDKWIESWKTSHKLEYPNSSDQKDITDAIKAQYEFNYILGNSPMVPNYEYGKTTDFEVLAIMAGNTLNYGDPINITETSRTGYVKYTSNSFKLDQYSFYKISIWVKTVNATASISISGDKEETPFESISSPSSSPTTYYFYTFTNTSDSTSVTFISTTPNNSPELVYDNVTYTLDNSNPQDVKYTTDTDANKTIKFANKTEVATASDWVQKTIYISTTAETSIQLELALGNKTTKSAGSVFFEDVKVEKIQLLDFYNNAKANSTSTPDHYKMYDYREINTKNEDSRNYTVIDDFQKSHGWTVMNSTIDDTDLVIKEESYTTGIMETFPKDAGGSVNKMLSITNNSTKEVAVKSTEFEFTKGRYYRVSLWAYSSQSNATLKVNLVSNKANETKETTALISTKPYLSDRIKKDTTNINNFWVNYVFFVQASADVSSDAYVKLTIPSGITINVDNFVIEYVSKKEYTDSSQTKLDLLSKVTDETITNGKFNTYTSVEVEDYSSLLPPSGWTSTKNVDVYEYYNSATNDKFTTAFLEEDLTIDTDNNKITYAGKEFIKADDSNTYNYKDGDVIKEKIVLVKNIAFSYNSTESCYKNTTYKDLEIESEVSAGIKLESEGLNTLNISSSSNEEFTYKSSVIKLTSNSSVYIISANVKTDNSATISLRLVDKDGVVYGTINNIETNNEWKIVKFYVGTGAETIELYLEINSKTTGIAQLKNISALKTTTTSIIDDKLDKTTEELSTEGIAIINLAKETFIEHSDITNAETHLFDANLYKKIEISGKTSGIYGILDTSNPHSSFESISAKDEDINPHVLIIKNSAGQSTQIDALKKFTVAKTKYMLITITARVEGLTAGKSATINFKSLNKTFDVTSTEFVEYKLYVDNYSSDASSTIDYAFALLDSAGMLIVDNVKVESLSSISSVQNEYPNGDTSTVKFVTTSEALEDQTTKEKEKADADSLAVEDEDNTLEIFLAIFSSLLLVAAIIFAIIFIRVKKLNLHKRKSQRNKVSETDDGQKGFV